MYIIKTYIEHAYILIRVYSLNISAKNGSNCIGGGKGGANPMGLQPHLNLRVLHIFYHRNIFSSVAPPDLATFLHH